MIAPIMIWKKGIQKIGLKMRMPWFDWQGEEGKIMGANLFDIFGSKENWN